MGKNLESGCRGIPYMKSIYNILIEKSIANLTGFEKEAVLIVNYHALFVRLCRSILVQHH
jgi:hypothetical protein